MKCGSVVEVENFMFLDGFLDNEEFQRKCVVLFEEMREDGAYVCLCPVVSQVSSFNRNPNKYYLLPITNKSGKKLMFGKLSSIVYMKKELIGDNVDWIDIFNMKRLIEKIKNNYLEYEYQEYYEDILNKVK